jgi:hypothetical protein
VDVVGGGRAGIVVGQLYHDMWWVADLHWPSKEVTPKLTAGGGLWITTDYHHPQFYQP